MSRGLSIDAITALSQPSGLIIRHLFEIDLPGQNIYITDYEDHLTHDGQVYLSGGVALSFNTVEETMSFQDSQTNITLSGIPDEVISLVTSESLTGRPFRAYRALLHEDGSFIEPPYLIYEGLMNGSEAPFDRESGLSAVTANVSTELARFNGKNGRRSNNEEQQGLFPGDNIFKFVAELSEKQIEY